MRQMTERSAKWVETAKANFPKATGKPVEAWATMVRKEGLADDPTKARKWLREKHSLTTVQVSFVLMTLSPEEDSDDELLDAQYAGAKAALRPVYEKLANAARRLGDDVMIAPRKSQVTFARKVSFAVVRAATKDRIDLLLRLPGEAATERLAKNAKATGSDPSHVVALRKATDVDREVVRWLGLAYERAGAPNKSR